MFKIKQNIDRFRPAGLVIAAVMGIVVLILSLPSLQAQDKQVVAIKGGTVLTMAGETIEGGTVVMWQGKIAAVGKQVSIPEGAQIIDATGKYVMPGIIDAMTYYGIKPFALNDRTKAEEKLEKDERLACQAVIENDGYDIFVSVVQAGFITNILAHGQKRKEIFLNPYMIEDRIH